MRQSLVICDNLIDIEEEFVTARANSIIVPDQNLLNVARAKSANNSILYK